MPIKFKKNQLGHTSATVRDGGGILHKVSLKKTKDGDYELRVGKVDTRWFGTQKAAAEYLNQFYTEPRESEL